MSKSRAKKVGKTKRDADRPKVLAAAPPKLSRSREATILIVILVVGATLRLVDRAESPPGLNQDEAVNAWNAWCLLQTGKDQAGVSWPLFYFRGLGSNYTPLNIYLLMPLQAIGGMNVWTTRAPAALGGLLTIFLIWFVGRRLVGSGTGLVAAGLLALNPWHLFTSRWGSEANLCPLLAILPLTMLLAAGLPPAYSTQRPRIILAAIGGMLTGLCLYGYPAILIFLPLFLVAVAALNWKRWVTCLREKRGLAAALAWTVSLVIVFAPLAYQHVFHGPEIRKRAMGSWIWEFANQSSGSPTFFEKVAAVMSRYAQHFAPDFLFLRGDHSSIESPPGMGMFHWYMLPLFVLGLIWCVRNFASSPAAKVILAWVVLYPIGDAFAWSTGDGGQLCLHSLRSSPGICGLVLLAAVGAASLGAWLWQRKRPVFWASVTGMAALVAAMNATYLARFFGEYNRRPYIYHRFHTDLVQASQWLRPRFDDYAAIFCTTDSLAQATTYLRKSGVDVPVFVPDAPLNQPYIVLLHELQYDPQRWLADEREMSDPNASMFDVCFRFGKISFLYPGGAISIRYGKPHVVPRAFALIQELQANGKPDRALFILRPGEEQFTEGMENLGPTVTEVRRPDGEVSLVLREAML